MTTTVGVDPWWTEHLVCPRDHSGLQAEAAALVCVKGHRYPLVEGVPVMLLDDVPATLDIVPASSEAARRPAASGDLYLSTLSLSDDERRGIAALQQQGSAIDPVVAYLIAATNGLMYRHLIGRLAEYPIPVLPLPTGGGRTLLDVGCSWGRWTLAASDRGYDAVGLDPSLGAVLAARRVAAQLGRTVRFVVGDARHLPFPAGSFDSVYSYSVLQHFSQDDASRAVHEMGRVLGAGGGAAVQFPTRYGLRCLYQQARRGFRAATGFEVRYWSRARLERLFSAAIGPPHFEVDGYFGIGLQQSDAHLMTPLLTRVLQASALLKRLSATVAPLGRMADSVFVHAVKAS